MDKASVERLCRPAAFDHPTGEFTVRETHISWVILCGDYAYKLKKAVDFGFLDFSSLERRRHYCEEELRLNRRFSPELYLQVVPVTLAEEGPMIGGAGKPVDYAVKMRRFDEAQLLDNIAARGDLDTQLVRSIARELARLHGELPRCFPDPSGSDPGTPAALKTALAQNFAQLRAYPLADKEVQQLAEVERWTAERYDAQLTIMQRRIRDGWIIDGHGDDHLGNMAIIDGKVRLFDCIEFNADFRILDSIAEIALLDMDLNARGHPAEAYRLLTDYLEYRDDFHGLALLKLYQVYFALVRAKVNILQHPPDHPDLTGTEAYRELQRYLGMAHRYCHAGQRFLAITHGVSGSGKSTVAGKLVEASGAVRIRSDVERKRLFGLAPEERSRPEDISVLYSNDMSVRTYERLAGLAEILLATGFPVIVDGTFLHHHVRASFRELARRIDVPFTILHCEATPGELGTRLLARESSGGDASEANVAVMEQQRGQLEPLTDEELAYSVRMDSASGPRELWDACQRLWRQAARLK